MMTRLRYVIIAVLAFASAAGFGVPAKKGAKNISGGFQSVPKQALVELKAVVGKPIDTGIVFVNGKYVPPPYKIERWGTAIRVNGMQVSDQIIPWDEFLKTQEGAKVEKVMKGGDAVSTMFDEEGGDEDEELEEEEEPEEDEDDWDDEDFDDDIDDLFDDVPTVKRSAPEKSTAKGKSALSTSKKLKERKAVEVTVVTFDGKFEKNEKSDDLLKKINKERTDIDMHLRDGGFICFGRGNVPVKGDKRMADQMLFTLPTMMKSCTDYGSFAQIARSKGLTYLPESVIKAIFKNRTEYVKLEKRAKDEKDQREFEKMLKDK